MRSPPEGQYSVASAKLANTSEMLLLATMATSNESEFFS
jgi:hypothetical protein